MKGDPQCVFLPVTAHISELKMKFDEEKDEMVKWAIKIRGTSE